MRAKALVVLVGLSLVGSACTDGGGSADAVRRVLWCFSRSGLLLSLFDGIQDGRVTSAEATHVSPGVSASDFVTPTT
jgi:hypothetical protein